MSDGNLIKACLMDEGLIKLLAFLCLPGPNENPFSVSKYIKESFFNAMEAGHHTLMDFFPINYDV